MISGLLGRKIGMTHYFGGEGRLVPVTVLEIGPCVITQLKTAPTDGYEAVQLGFGQAKHVNRPSRGHLKDAGDLRHLREFTATDVSAHQRGDRLDVTEFRPGELVDVIATSKGRGFQGVVKRYGFAGGPKTHGQGDRHRAPGSIGAGTFPGRVWKGKTMPGRMGGDRVTVRNLRVERVDLERNLLLVRGAVPGATKGLLMVRHAELDESKLPPRVEPEAMVDEAPVQEAPLEEQAPEAEAIIEEAATAVADQPTAGAEPDEPDAGPAASEKDRS
jgi:large subunit ribosomal protein L3